MRGKMKKEKRNLYKLRLESSYEIGVMSEGIEMEEVNREQSTVNGETLPVGMGEKIEEEFEL